jgi:hypothetical protein
MRGEEWGRGHWRGRDRKVGPIGGDRGGPPPPLPRPVAVAGARVLTPSAPPAALHRPRTNDCRLLCSLPTCRSLESLGAIPTLMHVDVFEIFNRPQVARPYPPPIA